MFCPQRTKKVQTSQSALLGFSTHFPFSLQYFYNSQTQDYLYWDATSKTYIPVPAGTAIEGQPAAMTAEDQAILSNPAADAPLELKKPTAPPQATELPTAGGVPPEAVYTPEKKDEDDPSKKDREEKPKSLAAVKVRHCWKEGRLSWTSAMLNKRSRSMTLHNVCRS